MCKEKLQRSAIQSDQSLCNAPMEMLPTVEYINREGPDQI